MKFAARGNLLASPWKFRPTGKSGIPMSELWQHLPEVADELCMLQGLCDQNVAHGGACMKLFTGSDSLLRPSMGSWMSYGLGTENENLPSFVVMTAPRGGPIGSASNSSSGTMPAELKEKIEAAGMPEAVQKEALRELDKIPTPWSGRGMD